RAWPVLRGPRRSNAPGLPDERWFGHLTEQKIRRSVHKSVQALKADIRSWIADWNTNPRPFTWTKTAEKNIESLARLCRRVSGAGRQKGHLKLGRPS
ncbi:hypothetical protein ACFHWU_25970, partial [Micromonospora sp. LOL_015]